MCIEKVEMLDRLQSNIIIHSISYSFTVGSSQNKYFSIIITYVESDLKGLVAPIGFQPSGRIPIESVAETGISVAVRDSYSNLTDCPDL